jgi:hypothetical protein
MKVLRAGFQVLAKPIVPAELITTIASTALRTPSICSSIALLGLAVVVMATFPRQRRGGGHQFHSMGSIGFDKCTSTPLCTARTRSSDRARSTQPAASREWDRRQRHTLTPWCRPIPGAWPGGPHEQRRGRDYPKRRTGDGHRCSCSFADEDQVRRF